MKRLISLIFIVLISITSCDILEQMNEVRTFVSCDFSVNNVKINKLGGYDISGYTDAGDIRLNEIMSLGQQVLTGKLPAQITIDIRAANNHTTKAAISGLEWELIMKNKQYGSGKLSEYVEVLPGKTSDFDVVVDFDLMEIINSGNLNSILDLVLDLDNKEKLNKLELLMKVKPYYKSGKEIREYPGFIYITP